ncbi:glycosyltransferase [Streptomyces sp. NBC_00237]|uniref:glycosyltransferase n=1 Tax=Streptomyces sp. NBC_00237 TaxID=2975687 RepID=UPI002254FE06|nr:glycosyltransferase [Streptomyces sp. NBC_00237]MCX5201165.1 glycosyltransferase [Streptomyces sp. NBC_00237]
MDIFLVSGNVDAPGGSARRARELAGMFAARGHRVRLIGIAPVPQGERRVARGADVPYEVGILYGGLPPVAPAAPRNPLALVARGRRWAHERGMRAKAGELSAAFRGVREGVVVVLEGWALEWVALADTAGMPVVLVSHEAFAVTRSAARFGRLRWLCRTGVDRVLAPTRQDADWWALNWLTNVGVMPAPVRSGEVAAADRRGKCVVSLGRLDHDKGTDILLDAWALVAPRCPGWRLRVFGEAGGGALGRAREEALRKQCAELGIADSVEWAGYVQESARALREGAFFVLPSRQEGFPLAPLEAMGAGLPCVAFDVSPGVREIVTDGVDGLLVRQGNLDELARKMETLMVDEELRERLGEAARGVVQRYAPEVVGERWEALFALLRR